MKENKGLISIIISLASVASVAFLFKKKIKALCEQLKDKKAQQTDQEKQLEEN